LAAFKVVILRLKLFVVFDQVLHGQAGPGSNPVADRPVGNYDDGPVSASGKSLYV